MLYDCFPWIGKVLPLNSTVMDKKHPKKQLPVSSTLVSYTAEETSANAYCEEFKEYTLFTIQNTKENTKPLIVTMTLNGKEIPMETDTGSAVTILPESTYRAISTEPLLESSIQLCTYSREKLEVKGSVHFA